MSVMIKLMVPGCPLGFSEMWLNDFVAAGYLGDLGTLHLDMDICSFESDLPGWKALSACALSAGASQRRLPSAPAAH